MQILTVLFSYLTVAYSSAIEISGTVFNQENEPVPFAHIYIENTGIGVVANANGQFILKVPEPYFHSEIVVSCVGYESVTVQLTGESQSGLQLKLSISAIQLEEVSVMAVTATALVELAIENLESNFGLDAVNYIMFSVLTKRAEDEPVLVGEFVYHLFHDKSCRPEFQILKIRARGFGRWGSRQLEEERLITIHRTESHMMLRYLPDFLKMKKMKKYRYTFADTRYVEGVLYLVVVVDSDNYLKGGELWINQDNYGICYLKETFRDEEFREFNHRNSIRESWYQQVEGKWFFSHGSNSSQMEMKVQGVTLDVNQLTVATERTDSRAFEKSEEMGMMVQMLKDFQSDFDDTFWKDYNYVPLDSTFQKALFQQQSGDSR